MFTLIQAKPNALKKPMLFCDKLVKLIGKDRAIGEHGDIGLEVSKKELQMVKIIETIEEIDHFVETNEVTLDGFEVDEDVLPNSSTKRP